MNAKRPRISVIIPHLNQPEHLRRCLASLAAQNYPRERFEVIAVDNGSAEPPTAALDELPGVRLEQEPQLRESLELAGPDRATRFHVRSTVAQVERSFASVLRRGAGDAQNETRGSLGATP